jgi:MFS family permease
LLVGVAPLWCVLGLAALATTAQAVASVFFEPARFVIVTDVVAEDQRGPAAGLAQASTAIAVILGPSLGALVFVQAGPALSFAINALTFLVSYAAIRSVSRTQPIAEEPVRKPRHFGRELLEPLRTIAGVPILRMLLITGVIIMLGAGTLNSLDVYFVAENLHAGPEWYGLISGAFGGGLLVGAVVAGVIGDRIGYRRLLAGALVVAGVIYLCYSRLTTPAYAVVAIAGYGFAAGCVETSLSPLILGAVSRDLLARVLSAFGPAFRLASIFSLVSAAWLVSLLRPGQTVRAAGIGFNRIELVFTAASALLIVGGLYAATARTGSPAAEVSDSGRPWPALDEG